MVANLEWVNSAPDSENNYTMACPFPLEGVSTSTGLPSAPDSENNYTMTCPLDGESTGSGPISSPNIPLAVLICRDNSHPFQKRTLLLHNPVKVGRSVAKTKADVNNAIFDCKVLSRYHASLWYENGRFYLADTKSSNGTFVNSYRLSEGSKESGPYEVSSGDIVQFGVDVIENSGSVTHGCIVATLKLYLPNGKEAKATPNPMPMDELHILHKIIQEATEREFILEEKLNSLHQSIDNCRKAAEVSWHAQVYEDHLLCRVLFLEKRLAAVSGTSPPTELQQLLEDKHNYEVSAKESLRQAQEERLKLMNQVCSLQWSLCSSEDECATFRKSTERANEEYQKLSSSHATLEQQLKSTQKSLTNAENRLSEEKRRIKELITDHEKEVSQIKAENEKHSLIETGISDLLDSQKSSIIIDNKSSDMIDYKESSLPEAIRGLPDYIKAILPEQVLQKVGCKSLRTSTQVSELQLKLYALKKELEKCQLESERTDDKVNDNTEHIVSEPETEMKDEISTSEDTNKQLPVNNENDNEDESPSLKNEEKNESENGDIINEDEKGLLNRKNTTYENSNFNEKSGKESINETKLSLLDEIKKLTEEIEQIEVKEEGPVEKMMYLQEELSSAQNTITSLKIEQKKLNTNLLDSYMNSNELVRDIDQLTFERAELVNEIEQKTELCRELGLKLSQLKEKDKLGEASNAKYKEVALELKNQLSRVIESEANSWKETKELNLKIAELQKQVDLRPQMSELLALESQIGNLKIQLELKEKQIEELNKKITILMEIEVTLEEKLSKLTVEQISPVPECEKEIISVTESCQDVNNSSVEEPKENIVISSTIQAANLMWEHDNGKFLTNDSTLLSSISIDLKRLSELEDELVATKEKWAHVNEDRSLLATELQNMTEKYNRLASRSIINSLVYIIPLAAALLYMLMYQSIS